MDLMGLRDATWKDCAETGRRVVPEYEPSKRANEMHSRPSPLSIAEATRSAKQDGLEKRRVKKEAKT